MTFPELIHAKAEAAAKIKRRQYFVRMFKPRFAPLVEAGTKLQTIRPVPKRMPRPGDTVSLRAWTGRPMWSKMRVLREARITGVSDILIARDRVWYGGLAPYKLTTTRDLNDFARDDGFKFWQDMVAWFEAEHGLPFKGILIAWEAKTPGKIVA
jgi:hypothetical protein